MEADLHQPSTLIVDGWCLPLLLGEVLATSAALLGTRPPGLPASRPFRDYVAWLQGRDLIAAEQHWRALLKGYRTPIELGSEPTLVPDDPDPFAERELLVGVPRNGQAGCDGTIGRIDARIGPPGGLGAPPDAVLRPVRRGLRRDGLRPTRRASRRGDHGRCLHQHATTTDTRGRKANDVSTFLRDVQGRLVTSRRHEYTPLVQIQSWGDVPRGRPLFESIVVFQNTPLDMASLERAGSLGVDSPRFLDRTSYPLTVTIVPGREMRVRIGYDRRRFESETIERMLGHLLTILLAMAADPGGRLAEVPMMTDAERDLVLGQGKDSLVERLSDEELESWIALLGGKFRGMKRC